MRVERVRGEVAAEQVRDLLHAAFAGQEALTPPSGALAESLDTIAADYATEGGVLLHDGDRLVGACRVRRLGAAWVIRRCAVSPDARLSGAGRVLVEEAQAWAADEGALRTHIGVRHALTGSRAFWERLGYRPLVDHGFWDELVRPLPLVLHGPESTRGLGERLAGELRAGDLVVLSGPLGAGKTALTQGIGAGLGVQGTVTSPTFVLARVHRGPLPLVHVDAYRLRDSGSRRLELDDLDLDASLPDSVTVVEWGEGLVEGLAEARLEVHLERPGSDDLAESRVVEVRPVGARWSVFG